MNEAGHEALERQDEAPSASGGELAGEGPKPTTAEAAEAPRPTPGEQRRQLDRPPSERYKAVETGAGATTASSRSRRLGAAAGVAVATAIATFLLITFDIGPGLLVVAVAGGWLTGLAAAGGAPAGQGEDAGTNRAATAATLAAAAIALGLLLDSLRAYALGGVLLPWEYQLARFGIVAPLAIVLAAAAGWLRGR